MNEIYNEKELNHLDQLSCRRDTLLSWLIRKATGSPVNHTATVVKIKKRVFIIDSQIDGTQIRPYEYWVKKYKYKYIIHRDMNMTNRLREEKENRAMDIVGYKGYDFLSLLWYHPLYLITGKWKGKKRIEALDRLYCSEATYYIELGDLNLQPTPKQVMNYFLKNESKYKTIDKWKILEKGI